MSCNYPAGMSRADLIHVGAIEDPDAAPAWFEDLVGEELISDTDFFWGEFLDYIEAVDGYADAESARRWFADYRPEAMNEDCRELVA